ncbi:unnamed protein product [Amoebophrya sp. A120]|nr:unnamed protein product [Amoebophrya sp. A120]|eukprot:GSA120T00023117001.1
MAYRKNGLRMEDLHSVKMDGLSEYVKAEEVEKEFSKFGTVQDVYIPRDYRSGRGKGFGFVRFEHKDEAEDAAKADITMDNQKIELVLATRGKRNMEWKDDRRDRGRRDSRDRRDRRGGDRRSRSRGGDRRGGRRDSRRR